MKTCKKLLLYSLLIFVTTLINAATTFSQALDPIEDSLLLNNDIYFQLSKKSYSEEKWKPLKETMRTKNNRYLMWYRIDLKKFNNISNIPDPALFIDGGVEGSIELYLEDEMIYKSRPQVATAFRMITLPEGYSTKTMFIKVGNEGSKVGLYGDVSIVNRFSQVIRIIRSLIDEIIISVISLLIGIVSLAFLLTNRKKENISYLPFSIISLCVGIHVFSRTHIAYLLYDNFVFWSNLELYTLYILPLAISFYFYSIFGKGFMSLYKGLVQFFSVALLAILGLGIFTPITVMQILIPFQALMMLVPVLIIASFVYSSVRGDIESRIIVVGFALCSVFNFIDLLSSMGITPWRHSVTHYGFIIFITSLLIVLVRRFVNVYKKIQIYSEQLKDYSENLEHKVEERTKQLQEAKEDVENTLREVKSLKHQQDGDYFLTSLILKPLMIDDNDSNKVRTEFYVSQKKKFKFKKWHGELGGDICISHSILLNNHDGLKKYTVFTNADAMGKSIQGAGGALVLGVVFNSFVRRTIDGEIESTLSPEEWLNKCFCELKGVFTSFDGSMLISTVMGLIDEETGVMYFYNAEHPWVALYRDNKATFIENDLSNRKIGTTIGSNRLSIQTFTIKPNDVILCGSDGKDDLIIYDEKEEREIINEDEELFLRNIEENNADVEKIVEYIDNLGELKDDLSILKISYAGEENSLISDDKMPQEYVTIKKEAINDFRNLDYDSTISKCKNILSNYYDRDSYLLLANSMYQNNNTKEAIEVSKEAMRRYPADKELIFLLSVMSKKDKRYEEAIYYGKRYYIHDSENVPNLINMADTYRFLRNYEKAENIIREAETLDPKNKKLMKLKNIVYNQIL